MRFLSRTRWQKTESIKHREEREKGKCQAIYPTIIYTKSWIGDKTVIWVEVLLMTTRLVAGWSCKHRVVGYARRAGVIAAPWLQVLASVNIIGVANKVGDDQRQRRGRKESRETVSPVSGSRKANDDRDWKCQPKSWNLLMIWCMMCKSPCEWPGSYY